MTNKEYYIKSLELQVELFKGRLDEAQAAFDELEGILMGVENIFGGWCNDECWTDYDERVRQQVLDFRKKHTYKPPEWMREKSEASKNEAEPSREAEPKNV